MVRMQVQWAEAARVSAVGAVTVFLALGVLQVAIQLVGLLSGGRSGR
ncbi:MAG: hypothetical protein M1565_08305 [Actinobacteria bacterium]|nr:hypothetical protein [Actinomycetota bacterium]